MIPGPDIMKLDMKADPDMIDLNLLVEDVKNQADVINRKHNPDPNILPLSNALAAEARLVIRIRRH